MMGCNSFDFKINSDINNDGLEDRVYTKNVPMEFVEKNVLYIDLQQKDASYKNIFEEVLLNGPRKIWLEDYDQDGDLDVMFAMFNQNDTFYGKLGLYMIENKGNDEFVKSVKLRSLE